MFFSGDKRYIVKTLTKVCPRKPPGVPTLFSPHCWLLRAQQAESRFLSVMLPSYLVHLQRYPATLIVKFVGSYSVKVRQSCRIRLPHAPGILTPLLIFPSDVWAQDLLYCHDERLSLGVAACTRCVRLEGGGVLVCVRSVMSTATRSSKAVLAGLLCEP